MKAKLLLIISLMVFFVKHTSAQTPNWLWADGAGGPLEEEASDICTDASGNVYVIGYYSSPFVIFGTTTLNTIGAASLFLVKYDATGNVVWARSKSGPFTTFGNGVKADASGNVYITGTFFSPTITFGTTTLTNTGSGDLFVAKYDSAGNALWAKSASGTGYDYGSGINIDPSGNVIVSGRFESASFTFGTTVLSNNGNADMFLAKYDSSGNVLWVQAAGGNDIDFGLKPASDDSGNIFVAGYFRSPTINFGTTTLSNAGIADMFLVKYNASGNVLWAKSAGDTSLDVGIDVATDAAGNAYVTGYYRSPTIAFGSHLLTNIGSNTNDVFLAKYDAAGNVIWANSAGSMTDDYVAGVAKDNSGNIYITGSFNDMFAYFGSTGVVGAGGEDFFIAEYNSSGTVMWAKSGGGYGSEHTGGIAVDASGNSYVAGGFANGSIFFGPIYIMNSGSTLNIFTAKLSPGPVGIEENSEVPVLEIYPNPSSQEIYIHCRECRIEKAELYNILGEAVLTEQIQNLSSFPDKSIDVSSLPPGLYFILVYTEHGVIQKMIVKD